MSLQAFLSGLQGGQLPSGTRAELDVRFGAQATEGLIAAGLLVRGRPTTTYPCPNLGAACPRAVVPNPGDAAFPFVAVPSGPGHCCDAVRLTAADLATWTTSRARLVSTLSERFGVEGPANLRAPVFPHAWLLGRAAWGGLEREALLCLDLNGPAAVAHLLARKAQRQPTLALAPARTRFTSPELDRHFAAGDVVVVFLERELALVGAELVRREVQQVREPQAPYAARPFCVLVDASGERTLDRASYDVFVSRAPAELDLLLDLTTTVGGGRHPTGRREGDRYVEGSLTATQAAAYAELMTCGRPVRAPELRALRNVNNPEKFLEAARAALDVNLSRYLWRATTLLRGDSSAAKRSAFTPPAALRWALLRPIGAAS